MIVQLVVEVSTLAQVRRYICDACGREFPFSERTMPLRGSVNLGRGWVWEDLCPDCRYRLERAIEETLDELKAQGGGGR